MGDGRIDGAQGDELFRLLVEGVKDYAIFALDPSGRVMTWNAGARHIKGYEAGEIIGHHFSRFYPEDAIRAGWPQTELDGATKLGRFEDEGWRIRKNGTRFWANVVITALHSPAGELSGFAKVTRDLTDRKRSERFEADAREMGEFIAMLGHELRNPLSPIRTAADFALQNLDHPTRLRPVLEIIQRQSSHMAAIVDDLLDVSRITRGLIRIERRRLWLHDVLDRALETLAPAIAQKGHAVTVDADDRALLRGDMVRLTQVMINLIGNACKYTPDKGRINIIVDVRATEAAIVVEDSGIGIRPDLLPRLFDLFTQDQRALHRSEGGLGLGLTIAKRLVEMHGGTVGAYSEGPGCGSRFTVVLPLAESDESTVDEAKLRVLIVDDNEDAVELLKMLVELNGHQASIAFDGEKALELAEKLQPDVILLDIGLPRMDGYEVARKIRQSATLQSATLVAITGYGTDEDRGHALDAGFDVHLTKPLDFQTLQAHVPSLLPGSV